MKKALIVIAIVVGLAAFGIYKLTGSLEKAGKAGDAAIAEFHADFNGNRGEAIYKAAAAALRSSVPPDKFTPFMALLHEKLGPWQSGERTGIKLNTNNGDTTLELSCSAKFAKGEGTEEFTFDYNGEKPLLVSYHVKSPALIEAADNAGNPGSGQPESDKPQTPEENTVK